MVATASGGATEVPSYASTATGAPPRTRETRSAMPMEDRLARRGAGRERRRRTRPTLAGWCPTARWPTSSGTASWCSRASPARRPVPRPGSGRRRSSRPSSLVPSDGVHHQRPGQGERRALPVVRRPDHVLLRGGGPRSRRDADRAQGAVDQQDRPRPPRPRPRLRALQLHARAGRGGRRGRAARRPRAAEHVHLQAAQHRGRGGLPSGRHVPLDRPDQRGGVLVRPGGRHARERLPVGCAGRPPGSAAPAVPARRRRRHGDGDPRRDAPAHAARRAAAAARAGRDDDRARRPPPPLERRQPLAPQPPRLLAPLHLGRRHLPGQQLAAAGTGHAAATPGRPRAAELREGSSA